jgi:hypothetical protein
MDVCTRERDGFINLRLALVVIRKVLKAVKAHIHTWPREWISIDI